MSGKRAKERRRQGLDRRTLHEQREVRSILSPPSQSFSVDPGTFAALRAHFPELDRLLLGDDGLLRILPAAAYARIPRMLLQLWARDMGYHVFPTAELVDWVRKEIGEQSAIEICAGAGVLGRALGIPCSDWDVCRRFPEMGLYYSIQGQPFPMLGGHCERLEALEAVARYRPAVVIGCYASQRVYAGEPSATQGSAYGVDERTLIQCVRKYIVVGSRAVHAGKRIWSRRTRELSPDWLVTRTRNPEDHVIAVWENASPITLEEALRQAGARPQARLQVPSTTSTQPSDAPAAPFVTGTRRQL